MASVTACRCVPAFPGVPYSDDVDFYSAYAQGFARVAAVTLPITVADPAANATRVLEQAGACDAEGVAVAVFPELCLSG